MIKISKIALDKSHALVDNYHEEISWIGFCTLDEQYNITIHDIYCPENQTTSAALVTITHEGDNELIDWEEEMRAQYGNGSCKAWFHSHVNMSAAPSGTDNDTLKKLSKGQPYYIRVIMNKKKDVHITISAFGFEAKVDSFNTENNNEYTEWAKEIIKKIINNQPKTVNNFNYGVRQSSLPLFQYEEDDWYSSQPAYKYNFKTKRTK